MPYDIASPERRNWVPATSYRRVRVGLVCPHNVLDRQSFSGSAFHAAKALAGLPGIDLSILGPSFKPGRLQRLRQRLRPFADTAAKIERERLDGLDALVGLVATRELDVIRQQTRLPYLHVTDATPSFLRDAYGWDIPASADTAEARVVRGAAAVLYSSDFMLRRAGADFGSPIRGRAIPFGINMDDLPDTCPAKAQPDPVSLLLVAKDWGRKGGEFAVAVLDDLMAAGIPARLTVVGEMPKSLRNHPGLISVGVLDKNRPHHTSRLSTLYATSHLLLVPSRADCTPMVVAEALAHGTPVIARRTGGMDTLVSGNRGRVMPADATACDWSRAIRGLVEDMNAYTGMSADAHAFAQERLTWNVWAQGVETACREAMTRAIAA